jgi:hypothetical protein
MTDKMSQAITKTFKEESRLADSIRCHPSVDTPICPHVGWGLRSRHGPPGLERAREDGEESVKLREGMIVGIREGRRWRGRSRGTHRHWSSARHVLSRKVLLWLVDGHGVRSP